MNASKPNCDFTLIKYSILISPEKIYIDDIDNPHFIL